MNNPKDYKEMDMPTEVIDRKAENGIKWAVIAQSLILMVVTLAFGMGAYFGDRLIIGMDGMHKTLIEIRDDISSLSTGVQINSTRIDNNDKRDDHQDGEISKNSKDILYLYSIK